MQRRYYAAERTALPHHEQTPTKRPHAEPPRRPPHNPKLSHRRGWKRVAVGLARDVANGRGLPHQVTDTLHFYQVTDTLHFSCQMMTTDPVSSHAGCGAWAGQAGWRGTLPATHHFVLRRKTHTAPKAAERATNNHTNQPCCGCSVVDGMVFRGLPAFECLTG